MWCLGTWFTGGHGSVRLTVEFNDLRGLVEPNDSDFNDLLNECSGLQKRMERMRLEICESIRNNL